LVGITWFKGAHAAPLQDDEDDADDDEDDDDEDDDDMRRLLEQRRKQLIVQAQTPSRIRSVDSQQAQSAGCCPVNYRCFHCDLFWGCSSRVS
jgi:hypothetical protein